MNYWLQRIGLAVLSLLAVSALTFGAMNVLGDPLFNILGPVAGDTSNPESLEKINDAFTYIFLTHTAWMNAFTDNVHGVCDRTAPDGSTLKCAVAGRTWFETVWIDG